MCLSEFILICTLWIFNLDVYSIPKCMSPSVRKINSENERKTNVEKEKHFQLHLPPHSTSLWCFNAFLSCLWAGDFCYFSHTLLNNLNSNCVLTAQQVLNCKLIGHFRMRKRVVNLRLEEIKSYEPSDENTKEKRGSFHYAKKFCN